ncbi:hypothetical protein [Phormidium tenue]|uniref:Uncharacterized protein n=1 Tax=Phormidium tenue NIES-30 TaxID=549789 RepID=A0A1U7IY82_9CYAN|nr:hypothetical protein [Phormidium tenue]MBD2234917.1 hypothetical protein [Phormidium tenue FACHB-1052]OKH43457.1 hypothetical protein NIES30_24925 [Phormidium tenue NIES-30]
MELFINIAVCELAFIWLERHSQYAIHSTQQSLPQGETKASGLAGSTTPVGWQQPLGTDRTLDQIGQGQVRSGRG